MSSSEFTINLAPFIKCGQEALSFLHSQQKAAHEDNKNAITRISLVITEGLSAGTVLTISVFVRSICNNFITRIVARVIYIAAILLLIDALRRIAPVTAVYASFYAKAPEQAKQFLPLPSSPKSLERLNPTANRDIERVNTLTEAREYALKRFKIEADGKILFKDLKARLQNAHRASEIYEYAKQQYEDIAGADHRKEKADYRTQFYTEYFSMLAAKLAFGNALMALKKKDAQSLEPSSKLTLENAKFYSVELLRCRSFVKIGKKNFTYQKFEDIEIEDFVKLT